MYVYSNSTLDSHTNIIFAQFGGGSLLIFIRLITSVILFDIEKAQMQDVNSGNIDVMALRSVSSHPNSLGDIQQLEMAFVTFTE